MKDIFRDPLGLYTVAHGKGENDDYVRGAADQFKVDDEKVRELLNQTLETQALALEGISEQCCDNCRELLQLHICHIRTTKTEKNNGDAGTETTKTTSKENTGTKQGL